MGEEPGTSRAAVGAASDPEEIERNIEQTRQELGDTVEALAQKTDVKAQARRKVEDAKATMSAKTEQLRAKAKGASPDSASAAAGQVSQTARDNPLPLAALVAFAAGFLLGRITQR